MSAILSALDTASKRWLAVLGAAVLVSIGILTQSFFNILFPSEQEPVAAQTPMPTEEAVTRTEPAWNAATPSRVADNPQEVTPRVSPFAAQEAAEAAAQAQKLSAEKMVHRQADYLRNLISQGKLPEGLGKLTKEQVDEMEKNGYTIN